MVPTPFRDPQANVAPSFCSGCYSLGPLQPWATTASGHYSLGPLQPRATTASDLQVSELYRDLGPMFPVIEVNSSALAI